MILRDRYDAGSVIVDPKISTVSWRDGVVGDSQHACKSISREFYTPRKPKVKRLAGRRGGRSIKLRTGTSSSYQTRYLRRKGFGAWSRVGRSPPSPWRVLRFFANRRSDYVAAAFRNDGHSAARRRDREGSRIESNLMQISDNNLLHLEKDFFAILKKKIWGRESWPEIYECRNIFCFSSFSNFGYERRNSGFWNPLHRRQMKTI